MRPSGWGATGWRCWTRTLCFPGTRRRSTPRPKLVWRSSMRQRGLASGARVAVVGGGVTAGAVATGLIQTSRLRGRVLDVVVFHGDGEPVPGAPAVLTPECRTRLAAL